ncbi:hypothetical protein BGZ88_011794 [Linnemannia elongata]|nr:hypothetical protein BGZ88_011794 [Linnemannia elongata]
MPLNPVVAGAVITAGAVALPFAVSLGAAGIGLSSTAVLASTVATRIMLACGAVIAKGGSACVAVKSITGVGLAKKALVVSAVVGVAMTVGGIAQTTSEQDDGGWPLAVYAPELTADNNGGNEGEIINGAKITATTI